MVFIYIMYAIYKYLYIHKDIYIYIYTYIHCVIHMNNLIVDNWIII